MPLFPNDPISRIEWRDAATLDANDYNPNFVFSPELRLLEHSLLTTGWVQPILIDPERRIIDGFHRARLARDSAAMIARYDRLVPCATLMVDRPQAMLLTIRMNRAKGTHTAVKMSAIIRELLDVHGLSPAAVAEAIGATAAEVDLLHQDGVFAAKKIPEHRYSKAWYPAEERR